MLWRVRWFLCANIEVLLYSGVTCGLPELGSHSPLSHLSLPPSLSPPPLLSLPPSLSLLPLPLSPFSPPLSSLSPSSLSPPQVSLQKKEFMCNGGDPSWLEGGIQRLPAKILNMLTVNKLLAHQPWLVTPEHMKVMSASVENKAR